jgi:hypothetical protein
MWEVPFDCGRSFSRRGENNGEAHLPQVPRPLSKGKLLQKMRLSINAANFLSRNVRSTAGKEVGQKMVKGMAKDIERGERTGILHEQA